jgi:putative nucleotidyltransferase with HDIG domain
MTVSAAPVEVDPLPFVRGLAMLRRLNAMYPQGHPLIVQKVEEVFQSAQEHLRLRDTVHFDIVHEELYVNGMTFRGDAGAAAQTIRELNELGASSIEIRSGLQREELRSAAEFLGTLAHNPAEEPIAARLAARGLMNISFGRIVPLDTRWRAPQWDTDPPAPLHPAYAESLARAEETFQTAAAGRPLDAASVRQLVHLLIGEVAQSSAAMAQILTIKQYENLTYCHSINVAVLSLMLGRQVRLDEATIPILVEAALLHDIGKTRVPLEVVQKPGALDRAERKLIEAHTTYGAEILVDTPGVHPLAATIALEHHRGVRGTGYPDLGEGVVPHLMSQVVSVADIYEALTGARSYREPMRPEQACLVLARESGAKLNTAFVKAFVGAVTFFPVGSLVRTNQDEVAIVTHTNAKDPLHPAIALLNQPLDDVVGHADTAWRGDDGRYIRHIVESLAPRAHRVDLQQLLSSAEAISVS